MLLASSGSLSLRRRQCYGLVFAPMPQHAFPIAKPLVADLEPGVRYVDLPVLIIEVSGLGLPSGELELRFLLGTEHAVLLKLRGHGVVYFPPASMSDVTGILPRVFRVPVAIVVSEAEPWLHTQIVYDVQERRLGLKQLVLLDYFFRRVRPEELQIVHAPGNSVPPRKDLVQKSLISAVVRFDLGYLIHEQVEGAVGRLDDHHTGVEQILVIARGRELGQVEQRIQVAQD